MLCLNLKSLFGFTSVIACSVYLASALPAISEDLRFETMWVPGNLSNAQTGALPLAQFEEAVETLTARGLALVDVETAVVNGSRVFSGLFMNINAETEFVGPLGTVKFREDRDRRLAQGQRLRDIEEYMSSATGRSFVGVWTDRPGRQRMASLLQFRAFDGRTQNLIAEGLRLVYFEVREAGGTHIFMGIYWGGAGESLFLGPLSRARLMREIDRRAQEGLELIDFERVGGGEADSFYALFRSGDDPAKLTGPLGFAKHFIRVQEQNNAGLVSSDFELQVVASSGSNQEGDTSNPPLLPENPAHVSFTDADRLTLSFTQLPDMPFTLELPKNYLPKWLPFDGDRPVLPDSHCGLLIQRADSFTWQIGDTVLETGVFNASDNVADLGDEHFLDGLDFSGPFGGCTDTQKKWSFPLPLTTDPVFTPPPNLKLVIEMRGDSTQKSQIEFIKDTGSFPKPIDPDKLFKDSSLKKFKQAHDFWDALENPSSDGFAKYCKGMKRFWEAYCSMATGDEVCPAAVNIGQNC